MMNLKNTPPFSRNRRYLNFSLVYCLNQLFLLLFGWWQSVFILTIPSKSLTFNRFIFVFSHLTTLTCLVDFPLVEIILLVKRLKMPVWKALMTGLFMSDEILTRFTAATPPVKCPLLAILATHEKLLDRQFGVSTESVINAWCYSWPLAVIC